MAIEWINLVIENISGATILIDDIGLELESSEQVDLSASFSFSEICESNDLKTEINNGNIRLSQDGGNTWLTATEANKVLTRIHRKYLEDTYYNKSEVDSQLNNVNSDISDLQAEVDNIEANVGLTSAGDYNPPAGSNYLGSTTTVVDGLGALDGQIKTNADNITANANNITDLYNTKVNRSGDTMTGNLNMGSNEVFTTASEPSDGTAIPNWNFIKSRIDAVAAGYDPKESVRVATTENLDATYTAGTAMSGYPGVGATLTANNNGALVVDGVTLNVDDRVLVWKQTDAKQNGIYVVTQTGDASNPWVLTRAEDFDGSPEGEVSGGAHTYAETGSTYEGNEFVVIHDGNIIVGTDDINWTISGGSGSIADLQAEVDRIEIGAGLDTDGNYVVDTTAHYISAATSIHNATQILDERVYQNYLLIQQNAQDIADLQNSDLSNIKVIDGRVYGKDTTRNRWIGPQEDYVFARNSNRFRRGYLKTVNGVATNRSSVRVDHNMILTSISIQMKNIDSTTVEVRNASNTVIATLTVNNAQGAHDNTYNVQVPAGEVIRVKINGSDNISYPVVKVGLSYDGGSL